MISRRTFLASAAAVPLAASIVTRTASVKTMFRSPGPHPNGLQASAEGLWILDQGDNRAYLVDYDDGKVIRKLDTDSKAGSGITVDGDTLWLASTYSREIIHCEAKTGKTIAKFDTPGAGVVDWPHPRVSPLAPKPVTAAAPKPTSARQATGAHGLEMRDGLLWTAVPPSKTIYRIEPKSFTVQFKFPTAGDRPHGLGWEGAWLWCVDSNDNAIYRYDTKTGAYGVKIQLADSDPLPHGMSIRDGWMWYCDDVGVVCKLRM